MVTAAGSPSQQVVEAAQNAAKSPHGLVNLVRLVSSLDSLSLDLGLEYEDDEVERAKLLKQVNKDIKVSLSSAHQRRNLMVECPIRPPIA